MTAARNPCHLVRAELVTPQPWRNHGGRTRELLAWPDRADWRCRISVAEIERDGPFSPYPGIDRWFAVVQGAGVVLGLPDGERHLHEGTPPLAFPGELAPSCRLTHGSTTDLNLMSARMHGSSRMERVIPDRYWTSTARLRACFTADAVTLHAGSEPHRLGGGTLLWTDAADGAAWMVTATQSAPRAWWLSVDDRAAP